MDGQIIFNLVCTIAGTLMGWILRVIWQEIKSIQADQREFEHEIADHYLKKEDYRIDIAEIKTMLGRIFDKLDSKVDKN